MKPGKPRAGGAPRFRVTDPKNRTVDGIIFASKAEMVRYLELKDLKADGRVRWFIRQPTFDLAGPVYKADFLAVWDSGSITVEEVKSPNHRSRPDWARTKRNMEQVYHLYGIKVALLERA
jgi:hypothetical protein